MEGWLSLGLLVEGLKIFSLLGSSVVDGGVRLERGRGESYSSEVLEWKRLLLGSINLR